MKLNNKGFAITAVLYGLLILFVILIGSYLTLLGTKKSRLDIITSDIEKDYEFNIIEYGPLGKIENEYSLYVNFNGENNILNVFGDIVNNN